MFGKKKPVSNETLAASDDPEDINQLGLRYKNGTEGTAQSDESACECFEKAAGMGSASAMYNLGLMHETGRCNGLSYSEALEWYQKAADLGSAQALERIGWMYDNGKGFPADKKQAAEFYQRSADMGCAQAQYDMAIYYLAKDAGTSATIAAGYAEKAAGQGHTDAMVLLSKMYATGVGVKQSYMRSGNLIREAAKRGNKDAQAIVRASKERRR